MRSLHFLPSSPSLFPNLNSKVNPLVGTKGPAEQEHQKRGARYAPSRIPLAFEPNHGQAESRAVYIARSGRATGEFRMDGVDLVLSRNRQHSGRVGIHFLGSTTSPSISAEMPSEGRVNYLLGKDSSRWIHNVPTFGRVRYSNIYPKIDLVFYGNGGAPGT